MQYRISLVFSAFLLLLFLGVACQKQEGGLPFLATSPKLPIALHDYSAQSNTKVRDMIQTSGVTNHGATLGRVLFYDKALSRTNTVSCGSCHFQSKGFADGTALSTGFDGAKTTKNAIGFSNLAVQTHFFWDGRENDLRSMVTKPIANHIEMGLPEMALLVEKLKERQFYEPLFQNAFGTTEITEDRIAEALSQFLKAVAGGNAPNDVIDIDPNSWWNSNTVVASITDPEIKRGADLFFNKGNCASCHIASFTSSHQVSISFGNIGLDSLNTTGESRFKAPSLRNIALTAPYMHDGRFTTLRQVVEHYSEGIKPNPMLSWQLGGPNSPAKFNFTAQEKTDLIKFLEGFTDQQMMQNQGLSDPF